MSAPAWAAPDADVDATATLEPGCMVWPLAQIRERAHLGAGTVVGRGAYIGAGITVGPRTKIQNHALVYEPARIGTGVFIGPAAVLTNDTHPRAVNPDGTAKSAQDWDPVGVTLDDGCSIGARAVCVAPVRIGRWAVVAAGAVVTRDVPDHALVAGVPGRRAGWVGRAGHRLVRVDGELHCPVSDERYTEVDGRLEELT